MMLETLQVVGLGEAVARTFRLRKKPMNLCACDIEYREHGDECEDVGMGWVCSKEVTGALGVNGGRTGCQQIKKKSFSWPLGILPSGRLLHASAGKVG
jgi:hypothetical protein